MYIGPRAGGPARGPMDRWPEGRTLVGRPARRPRRPYARRGLAPEGIWPMGRREPCSFGTRGLAPRRPKWAWRGGPKAAYGGTPVAGTGPGAGPATPAGPKAQAPPGPPRPVGPEVAIGACPLATKIGPIKLNLHHNITEKYLRELGPPKVHKTTK